VTPEHPEDLVRQACAESLWYFLSNYVYTQDPQADDPTRKFPSYGYLRSLSEKAQKKGLDGRILHKLIGVEKSRQLLLSWWACGYALWRCGFEPGREGMIQSQKEDKAIALISRMRFILRHVPQWLFECDVRVKSKEIVFTFKNGDVSRIWCVPQGEDQVASYEPTFVIFDEAALQEHFKAAYYTALPAIKGPGGQLIAISSPRANAFFTKFCYSIPAVERIRIHYRDHPEFAAEAEDMKHGWKDWKREKRALWGYEDEAMWEREMEINHDVTGGVPAFKPPFDQATHVSPVTIQPHPNKPIQRGWDFGFHHPACVWTQVADNGQWLLLRSMTGKRMHLSEFTDEVKRRSKKLVPFPNEYSFQDFCDPEGYKKNRAVAGPSAVDVLNAAGIFPINDSKKVPVKESVLLIRENMRVKPFVNRATGQKELRPGMLVDPSCTNLLKAFNGTYGTKTDDDEKFEGGITQHEVDGLRYIAAGTFELAKAPR
jgi:hypothetical protein